MIAQPSSRPSAPSFSAFTLIELLVVIAIISIIAAILFPVFAQVREKAREVTCVSNMRQIGISVQEYLQDYDETMPIFTMYDLMPGQSYPGQTGFLPQRGVEVELQPYIKSTDIFHCPDDNGDPSTAGKPYYTVFGSSYRFGTRVYTDVAGYSSQNDSLLTTTNVVTYAQFIEPADTRIMRDEDFPWFGPQTDPSCSLYGYSCAPPYNYFEQWHPRGGTMVFADGHSKFITTQAYFNQILETPDGQSYKSGCWTSCD